jgi:hypothetical protein
LSNPGVAGIWLFSATFELLLSGSALGISQLEFSLFRASCTLPAFLAIASPICAEQICDQRQSVLRSFPLAVLAPFSSGAASSFRREEASVNPVFADLQGRSVGIKPIPVFVDVNCVNTVRCMKIFYVA